MFQKPWFYENLLFVFQKPWFTDTMHCWYGYPRQVSPADSLAQQQLQHIYLTHLRRRQNGQLFADAIFKCIFLNKNVWIPIKLSLKFVSKGPINNIPALVQIMAWRQPGDKPLSEPMVVRLPTHICLTGPQWVNTSEVRSLLVRASVH